jgi:hypothetical protein
MELKVGVAPELACSLLVVVLDGKEEQPCCW